MPWLSQQPNICFSKLDVYFTLVEQLQLDQPRFRWSRDTCDGGYWSNHSLWPSASAVCEQSSSYFNSIFLKIFLKFNFISLFFKSLTRGVQNGREQESEKASPQVRDSNHGQPWGNSAHLTTMPPPCPIAFFFFLDSEIHGFWNWEFSFILNQTRDLVGKAKEFKFLLIQWMND